MDTEESQPQGALKQNRGLQLVTVIVLTFLVLAIPLGVYLAQRQTRTTPQAGGPISGPEQGDLPASLYLAPQLNTSQVTPGQAFDVDVVLNSGESEVTAAEIVIDYDTALLETTQVVLGDFLAQELVAPEVKTVGNQQIVKFTVGSDPENPRIGEGVLATLKMKAKTTLGDALISFNETTQVAAVGSNSTVLGQTYSTNMSIVAAISNSLGTYFDLQGLSESSGTQAQSVDVSVMIRPPSSPGATPNPAVTKTVTAVRANDGLYDILITDVPTGLQEVLVKGPRHLRKLLGSIQITSGSNYLSPNAPTPFVVLNGDIVDNNAVDIFDYALLVEDFGPRMPQNGSPADLDLDQDVDIFDYSLVVENFNQQGD